jgi:radical SAM superfamily enzyme YgiQ (UPF0313 family)
MTTILINSPLFREHNKLYDEDALPPLGLGYIGTVLRENGLEVDLIDAVAERIPLHELIKTLNEVKPAYIASNIFTTNYELVKELVESIHFSTHLIIGGLSTKQLYQDIFEWNTKNPIDVVTGDGELITLDIIRNQLKEVPASEALGRRYFMVGKKSIYEVKNLDDVLLDRRFFVNEPINHPLGFWEANIVTSRGCIYNCTFCAAARSLNRDYSIRERSEQSIRAELETIGKDYPHVESIRVLDDLFLKTRHTVQKAIDVFSGFDFKWRSMAHVMTFHKTPDTTMQELKASGCHELFIGIESGSPNVLGAINKTKNIDTIIANLTKAFRAGINIKGYFIYGFPNETEKDMDMTFRLAATLKKIAARYGVNFRTSVFQYRPYHGTQIYHDLESEGYDLQVKPVQPNQELSSLVGRLQFNFHNGNYSKVDSAVLNDYIYRTINLNDGKIFAGLGSKLKADQY